jgi:predicted membrane chloride channel (bestrophin family)
MKALFKLIKLPSRWTLAVKVLPFVAIIIILKFAVHYFGAEFLSLSSLFTAVVSANIFLIGFLISGVLVDYKESEKIPGDMAACLETMADECMILHKTKNAPAARQCLGHLQDFASLLVDWFHKKERTTKVLDKISAFNDYFIEFESHTQANFIVRLKQEQNLIRKMIYRVHTIRETSFIGSGYAIVELITAILIIGLVFIKIDPYYESVFFVAFVSFILIYMIYLIKEIDNPFGYHLEDNYVEDVSLKPLLDVRHRLKVQADSAEGKQGVNN